jgi:hypothetical protein
MSILKRLAVVAAFAPVILLGLPGCGGSGLEEVGEDIDEAVDDVGDALKK